MCASIRTCAVARCSLERRERIPGALDLGERQFDLEVDLERDDLAWLLDRALALLSPETREVLVFRGYRDVQTACPHCGRVSGVSTVGAVAFDRPAGWAFERERRRIRTLPGREVEAAGVPAIVARFESVAGSARLEVVLVRDTLDLIGVHGAPISARSNRLRHT